MEKMTNSTIGLDVSKDTLDAHRLPDGAVKRFANDAAGHKALIRWVKAKPVDRIVFEATGSYSRAVELALTSAGLPAIKVNPRQARRFAEAIGKLAKTDAVDAAVLARMGKALELSPKPSPSPNILQLKELLLIRRALVKDQTAAKNRQKVTSLPIIEKMINLRITQIEADIADIDAEVARLIAQDPELTKRAAILTSIPGIGNLTAAILLIEMPELGTIDAKQAASLAGLAPMTQASGNWKGNAHIRGGRAILRQTLYMPALVAIRFNPDLKRLYNRLTDAGKPPKIAITAVMRKLLIFANTLIKKGYAWNQKPACA
jgi:transposase